MTLKSVEAEAFYDRQILIAKEFASAAGRIGERAMADHFAEQADKWTAMRNKFYPAEEAA